jgi:hypothetical protein
MGFALERLDHGAAANDVARPRQPSPAIARTDAKTAVPDRQDWRARQVHDWLFLLLRFAITRDPDDLAAALRTAGEIDSLGASHGSSTLSFFRRTTGEVCAAITTSENGPEPHAILVKHLARIEDPRLKRAFRAALGFDQSSPQPPARANRQDLWSGLPR